MTAYPAGTVARRRPNHRTSRGGTPMTDHVPDIPVLRKCVEWVEEQDALPDKGDWHQATWIESQSYSARLDDWWAMPVGHERTQVVEVDCGTKACVCGHLGIISGAEFTLDADGHLRIDGDAPAAYGARALGISLTDARDLFDASNTAAEVRRVAEGIAARVGERL